MHFTNVEEFQFGTRQAGNTIDALSPTIQRMDLRRIIFVAPSDLHFGMARMLQTMYEMHAPGYATAIVRGGEEFESLDLRNSG